jgi:hypothetical protein
LGVAAAKPEMATRAKMAECILIWMLSESRKKTVGTMNELLAETTEKKRRFVRKIIDLTKENKEIRK